MELFTRLFGNLLTFVYHCFDRIVIHGYLSGLSRPEQVVHFFRQVLGIPVVSKEVLEPAHRRLPQLGGGLRPQSSYSRWSGRRRACAKRITCCPRCAAWEKRRPTASISSSRAWSRAAPSASACRSIPPRTPTIASWPTSAAALPTTTSTSATRFWGRSCVRVASFFPFHATYWLNGHSFIERELDARGIGFHKNDNAFLAVDDVAALQAAADRLSPAIIRKQLDYWTLILGPKFSNKERSQMNLSRFYAIAQIEYCRNFIFKRHFPIHKIFERSCEIGLWRLTANRISEIFGVRLHKQPARQAGHRHRPDRAWPSRLPRLLEERLSQTVREVLPLPAQRTLLQQPARLRSEERTRPSRRRAPDVPDHHRPLCRLPGPVPQRPRGLSPAAAARPAHHHRLGPLSRHQDPRRPDHPAAGGLAARRHSPSAAGPPSRSTRPSSPLPALRRRLRAEPAPLRSAQTQRPRPAATRRPPLCLPPHRQRASRSRSCSCSSTNASAARWPTAVSTTSPIPAHRPNSKLEAAYHKADKAIENIVDLLAAA